MDVITIAIFVLLLALMIAVIWIIVSLNSRRMSDPVKQLETSVELLKADLISKQTESLLSLRNSLDSANKIINERLAEGTSSLDKRMAVLGDIEHRLGELSGQASNIEAVGKNIQSLSDLLRPPKMRGGVGELLLENLLSQILPPALYETQYRFEGGQRVDAVIKIGDKILPIDAKFSLETYERLNKKPDDSGLQKEFTNVFKKHVNDISSKYIRPSENTTDFALMYIPAEAVYYQLITQDNKGGFDHALTNRVIPSSPALLYAFLASTAVFGAEISLASSDLAGNSRRLLQGLKQLLETTEHIARFHVKMESSLRTLTANFDKARQALGQTQLELEKLSEPFESESNVSDNIPHE